MTALESSSSATKSSTASDRVRLALERRLGIDPRALATVRIALGSILLFDLLHRSQDLVTFYTDAGVLPRSVHLEQSAWLRYSIHMLSGEAWVQAALFGLAGALAVSLIVGYRTRLVTALSVILLVSLHVRNPYVLNGADRLFREVLLLAIFLPLGSWWAIDARSDERPTRVTTPATVAALGYVVSVLFNNAILKLGGETWPSGEALHYALRQDEMTILLGNHAANIPLVPEIGTYVWFGLLLGSPLLLALTGWLRTGYVAALVAGAITMGLTMAVGLFPPLLATVALLFLPPRAWDVLETVGSALLERVAGDDGLERARNARVRLGRPRRIGSTLSASVRRRGRQAWTVVLGCLLVFVVVWTAGVFGVVDPLDPVDGPELADNQWKMFAPDPTAGSGWYVVGASLENGDEVDLLRDGDVGERRTVPPPDASETIPAFRWRRYMTSLSDDESRADRFAEHMCERADERHDSAVENVTVTYTHQPIDLENETETSTYDRAEAACSSAS